MWCCRSCRPLLDKQDANRHEHEPAHLETMFGSNHVTENGTNETDGPKMNTDRTVESHSGDVVDETDDQADDQGDDQTSSSTSSPVEPKNKPIAILLQPQRMSELSFPEGKAFQERYRGYWAYIIAIVLFYAIPTYQLVLTYQRVRREAHKRGREGEEMEVEGERRNELESRC